MGFQQGSSVWHIYVMRQNPFGIRLYANLHSHGLPIKGLLSTLPPIVTISTMKTLFVVLLVLSVSFLHSAPIADEDDAPLRVKLQEATQGRPLAYAWPSVRSSTEQSRVSNVTFGILRFG
uniref:Secreted protein n=1 Tax=Steinernema glaseri TaxID=37863 RepID=A0A1I8AKL0_9BILA